jgi:hypothetical protein
MRLFEVWIVQELVPGCRGELLRLEKRFEALDFHSSDKICRWDRFGPQQLPLLSFSVVNCQQFGLLKALVALYANVLAEENFTIRVRLLSTLQSWTKSPSFFVQHADIRIPIRSGSLCWVSDGEYLGVRRFLGALCHYRRIPLNKEQIL